MSHFVVAVFHNATQSYEDLLAPYSETDEEYMEFLPASETQEELYAEYDKHKDKYSTFEEYMRMWHGYVQDASGKWGYMSNPDARWDWYQEGGRYDGFFRDKKTGEHVNEILAHDLDLSCDPEEYKKAIRFWEVAVEGQPQRDDEDIFCFFKPEYYIEQYGTKEEYAESVSSPTPWAFVTAEGDWIENGQMGWFACHDATHESRGIFTEKFMEYVKANPSLVITVVDCHI